MKIEKYSKNKINLEKLQSLLFYQDKSISVYRNKIVNIVHISKIVYIKSFSNYSAIFLSDGDKIMTSKTLKHWENKIDNDCFIKSHNSYLINCKYVESFDLTNNVVIVNNIVLPISKTKKNKLVEYFN